MALSISRGPASVSSTSRKTAEADWESTGKFSLREILIPRLASSILNLIVG
jgi:hypothetical protein